LFERQVHGHSAMGTPIGNNRQTSSKML
jgi:hypothetical protein